MGKRVRRDDPESLLDGDLDYVVTFCAAQTSAGREGFGAREKTPCPEFPIPLTSAFVARASLTAHPPALDGLAGLDEQDVEVDFGPQHDRAPHPSDDAIEATWQLQLRDTPRLWDASKFRLAGGRVETRPASDPDRPAAILRLGLTSYKHHVGTSSTARPDADRRRLRRDGLERHGSKHAHLSAALGVETAVETADGRLVLLRRSASVASFSGAYNGPSGHPEPANVRDLTPRSIRRELFDAALREVTEETGIPAEALSRPRLIGAMIDADGKPDVLFRAETSATSRQVREWASRASDAWESSGMAFAPATPATANEDVGDGSRLVDLWGGADDVSVSAVTRAAADCLCMLAATAKDAAPEPKVWERALDAALEHEMFDVARRIERAQLARVGSG